jgi:FixH
MNWGKSIVLCFILFASFIGIMAYRMATAKVDLVQADYYQKEIDYQQQIDRIQNSKTLNNLNIMTYLPSVHTLRIAFPSPVTKGEVNFYRTSDKELDFKVPLSKQTLFEYSTKKLQKGHWKIQSIWSDGAREYFVEKEINIQ